jgi:dihydrofolate reductase
MRTIVHAIYVSLDGVVSDPAWTSPFFNDELAALQRKQLFASDALLLGRVTYEAFASSWPTMTDDDGFAERMNSLPKYIASRTLTTVTWGGTVLRGNVEEKWRASGSPTAETC